MSARAPPVTVSFPGPMTISASARLAPSERTVSVTESPSSARLTRLQPDGQRKHRHEQHREYADVSSSSFSSPVIYDWA